jgi:hypothetical protein
LEQAVKKRGIGMKNSISFGLFGDAYASMTTTTTGPLYPEN